MCVHVWVHTCVCSYTCVWRWEDEVTCLPLCLELINWLCCLSSEIRGSVCLFVPLHSPSTEVTSESHHVWQPLWVLDSGLLSLCLCDFIRFTHRTISQPQACVLSVCFSKAGTKPKALIAAKPKALGPIPQVYILFRWLLFLLWLSHLIFQKQFDYKSFNFLLKPHILSIEYLITEYIREQVMDKEYILFLCVQFTQRVPGARDQGPGHSIKLPTKPVWV